MTSAELRRFLGIGNAYIARRLFAVLDDDGDGRVSETEFLKSVVSLILGEDEDKLRFIFRLHDDDADGKIDAQELDHMLQACLSSNRIEISMAERHAVRDALLAKGRRRALDFSSFRRLLAAHELVRRKLIQSVADWFGAEGGQRLGRAPRRGSAPSCARRSWWSPTTPGGSSWWRRTWRRTRGFSGWPSAATGRRARTSTSRWPAAQGACLNFNGMLILLPMIRTLMRWIRETFLFALIPVDHNIGFHKIVGYVLFFFALLHTGAHFLNYTTLSVPFMDSLLRTKAGLSGLVLLGDVLHHVVLRAAVHPPLDALRGCSPSPICSTGRGSRSSLSMPALSYPWAAVPVAGFLAELVIRRVHKRTLSFVRQGEALPTGVTHLKLHRPDGFEFEPGEFAYLKIPRVSAFGWHPFTISSNPEDRSHIGLHIRALGNWTRRLHRLFTKLPREKREMPVLLQGPYGSPSARIFASHHAVLIGAGIGVTPFASILQSIVARHTEGRAMKLEKVHFFWLYRGQKTYAWFSQMLEQIDALRLKLLEITSTSLTPGSIPPRGCSRSGWISFKDPRGRICSPASRPERASGSRTGTRSSTASHPSTPTAGRMSSSAARTPWAGSCGRPRAGRGSTSAWSSSEPLIGAALSFTHGPCYAGRRNKSHTPIAG